MLRLIYSLVFYLVLPLVFLRVFWRARQEPRYSEDLGQRLGHVARISGKTIWVHAVSAGETIAAERLIRTLLDAGEQVVISNMTPAGRERAEALFPPTPNLSIVYAPYDLPHGVARSFARLNPKALIIIDTELWPNMLATAKKLAVPVYLVNGRLSEKSAAGYDRIRAISKPMFQAITRVFAQTESQAMRFLNLGAEDVVTGGSIKFDAKLPEDFSTRVEVLIEKFSGRKVLLAASTHDGEERIMLKAFQQLTVSDQLLVIAPRHIHRLKVVESLLDEFGFAYQLHSKGAELDPQTKVYVVDTMGDLIYFYGVCESAFVGGSLVDVGGHNPMEPGSLGKPMMMGPYRRNISDIAELFADQGAMVLVEGVTDVLTFWQDTENSARKQAMSEAALTVMEANRGALQKVMHDLSNDLGLSTLE